MSSFAAGVAAAEAMYSSSSSPSKSQRIMASLLLAPAGQSVADAHLDATQRLARQQKHMHAVLGNGQPLDGLLVAEDAARFDPLGLAMARPRARAEERATPSAFPRPSLNPYEQTHAAHMVDEEYGDGTEAGGGGDSDRNALPSPVASRPAAPGHPALFDEEDLAAQVWQYRQVDSARRAARQQARLAHQQQMQTSRQRQPGRVASLVSTAAAANAQAAAAAAATAAAAARTAAAFSIAVDVPVMPVPQLEPTAAAAAALARRGSAGIGVILPQSSGTPVAPSTPDPAAAVASAAAVTDAGAASSAAPQPQPPLSAVQQPSPGHTGDLSSLHVVTRERSSSSSSSRPSTAARSPPPPLTPTTTTTSTGDSLSTPNSLRYATNFVPQPLVAHLHPQFEELSPGLGLLSIQALNAGVPSPAAVVAAAAAQEAAAQAEVEAQAAAAATGVSESDQAQAGGKDSASLSGGGGKPPPKPSPSRLSGFSRRPPLSDSVLSLPSVGADVVGERERLAKVAAEAELDRLKSISHQQYMRLVMRHVRTRLIQEKRFVVDPATDPERLRRRQRRRREAGYDEDAEGDEDEEDEEDSEEEDEYDDDSDSHSDTSEDGPGLVLGSNIYDAQAAIRQRDKWAGSLAASAMNTRPGTPGPVALRDIEYEVTGVKALSPQQKLEQQKQEQQQLQQQQQSQSVSPQRSPQQSVAQRLFQGPGSKGGSTMASRRSTQTSSFLAVPMAGHNASPSSTITGAAAATAAAAAAAAARGEGDGEEADGSLASVAAPPDPMADISFHIDPLDPSRPENVGKVYRLNPAYTGASSQSYPLWSRGPSHSWQTLLDEEEVLAYRKVLWLCAIQALSHVSLDGMLQLIGGMAERAFDVETLLRAGEPGECLYFIKAGEVQLRMERTVIEQMEGAHAEAEAAEAKGKGALHLHPHPQPPAAHSPSSPPRSPSRSPVAASSLPALPGSSTDDANRFVEIAKLGPTGICGEDILLSPLRRYTLISLTPVWLYEVRAADLLRVFEPRARAALCEAVAHTQRVRERHALVKNRTRLQHHAAPTLFRHFLDDSLQRNLTRQGQNVVAARQAKDGAASPRAQRGLRGASPERLLVGRPDALRAVLHDLDHIQAKQMYRRRSPARIEAIVQRGSGASPQRSGAHTQELGDDTPTGGQQQQLQHKQQPSRTGRPRVAIGRHNPYTVAAADPSMASGGDGESKEQVFLTPPAGGRTQHTASSGSSPAGPASLQVNVADDTSSSPTSPLSPSAGGGVWRSLRSSLAGEGDSPLKRLVRQRSVENPASPSAAAAAAAAATSIQSVALSALENARMPAGSAWLADAAAAEAASHLSPPTHSSGGGGSRPRRSSSSAGTSPDGPRRRAAYDPSPFSLRFREGSVLEKSRLAGVSGPGRGGAVGLNFSAAKQHVTRGSIVPLRVQSSAIMILGEAGQLGAEEGLFVPELTPAASAANSKSRRRTPSTLGGADRGDGCGSEGVMSSTGATVAAARKEGAAVASPSSRSLRPSASLPALAAGLVVPSSPSHAPRSPVLRQTPSEKTLQFRQTGSRLVPLIAHATRR